MSGVTIPVIDIGGLESSNEETTRVAREISIACRESGFFYVVGHGVSTTLQDDLLAASREFFALPLERKLEIRMELGGPAWRGYFPLGTELTSGQPDHKEGIYFGSELPNDHPRVRQRTPLHGPNLFPDLPDFRETIIGYIGALTTLGHRLMEGIALSLNLDRDYFAAKLTTDPLILFRVFHYPPLDSESANAKWSVGEHTDYGLLTILRQDDVGGLQVKSSSTWIDAAPIENAFVCNIGDMLDRLTNGLYHSTAHRVQNASSQGRLSFPFFFDPDFEADVNPIEGLTTPEQDDADERWDKVSVRRLSGTYGQYLMRKIAHVFPELAGDVYSQQDSSRSDRVIE